MTNTEITFKELLRKAQGNRSLNQYAQNAGISSAMLSHLNSGTRNPSPDLLKKLAAHSENGVSYYDLMVAAGFWSPTSQDSSIWALNDIKQIEKRSFPVLGEIACGEPIMANEEKELFVEANSHIDADFCLIAKGDSMTGARIYDGDIIFIKKQPIVENGEIAAVLIDGEVTLKRFYYFEEQNLVTLNPENPAYSPLVYKKEDLNKITVLGKAVAFTSGL